MPNPRYRRGADFERKVQDLLTSVGYFTMRGAGSHGIADIVAIYTRAERIWFVQCKTDGKISPADWNELVVMAKVYGAEPVLASKHPAGGIRLEYLTDMTRRFERNKSKVEIDLSQ